MTTQTSDVDTKLLPLRWVTAAMMGLFMALFAFFPWLRDDSDWVSGVGRESAHDLTDSNFPTTTIGYLTLTVGLTIAALAILHMYGRVAANVAAIVTIFGGGVALVTTLCLSVDEDWNRTIGYAFTIVVSIVALIVGLVSFVEAREGSRPSPEAAPDSGDAPTKS